MIPSGSDATKQVKGMMVQNSGVAVRDSLSLLLEVASSSGSTMLAVPMAAVSRVSAENSIVMRSLRLPVLYMLLVVFALLASLSNGNDRQLFGWFLLIQARA